MSTQIYNKYTKLANPINLMSQRTSSSYELDTDELLRYVVRKNYKAVRAVLKQHPHAANKLYQNRTLLEQACRSNDLQMIKLLIQCGAQVNIYNSIGSPPLVNAIYFNQFQIVQILIQNKSKIEGLVLKDNLTVIDYAILHGKYKISNYIYTLLKDKTLKLAQFYETIAKKQHIRYINYTMFIEGMKAGKSEKQVGDFQKKITPQQYQDEEDCCYCCFPFKINKEPLKQTPKSEQNPETERKSLKN